MICLKYRWSFQVDKNNPKKLFNLKDFVGFVAQTLSSEIREQVAKFNFEQFHPEAARPVKQVIFNNNESKIFHENSLEIFGVDVEGINPSDPEIQKKLSNAIKTNVDIFTKSIQEEAQLKSERRLIEGRAKNEKTKAELIKLEIENRKTKVLEDAKIDSQASTQIVAAEAEAITIKAKAEREAEELRLKAITAILNSQGGKDYINLELAKFGQGAEKVFVVPTDSRVHIGVDKPLKDEQLYIKIPKFLGIFYC